MTRKSLARVALVVGAFLLTVGSARGADQTLIASVDVGGGVTKTQYRYGEQSTGLFGPGLEARGNYGSWYGRFGTGFTAGALLVPSFESATIAGSGPESLTLIRAGGFGVLRLSELNPILLSGRLEVAYGRLLGSTAIQDGPSSRGVLASSVGGTFALRLSYERVVATHATLAAGIEGFGGGLFRPGSGPDVRLIPFGAMATLGLGWR